MGEWSNYFQLWLTSYGFNPDIDFFLISDIDASKYIVPKNVIIVRHTFETVKRKSIDIFKEISKISLDRPYKLCDLKRHMAIFLANTFLIMIIGDTMILIPLGVICRNLFLPIERMIG